MYPVSQDFLDHILDNGRQIAFTGTITNGQNVLNFTKEHIISGSGTVSRETTGDNTFRFGGGCAAELDISFPVVYDEGEQTEIDFSDYLAEGAKIELNFTLTIPGTTPTTETIPVGVFYIKSVSRGVSNKYTVLAYDSMYKLHKQIDTNTYSLPTTAKTPYEWFTYICNACGVTLGNTQAEIEALTNGATGMIYAPTGKVEWFTLLSALAEMLASFAYVGRDDKLYLRAYSDTPDFEYGDSSRYSTTAEDFESFYTAIHGTAQDIYKAESTNNGLLYETDNPFIFPIKATAETAYQNILDVLSQIVYRPLSVQVLVNPALDPSDMIEVTSTRWIGGMNTLICPIMKMSYTLYGKCSIDGYGDNPNAKDTNGSVSRSLNGLTQTVIQNTVSIEELKQSAIKFLLPSTTDDSPIADGETNQILEWNFQNAEGAEVAIHASIGFEIETTYTEDVLYGDAVLTLTLKLDGSEIETYTETYGDGDHVLTINHIIVMEVDGIHSITAEITMNGGDLT